MNAIIVDDEPLAIEVLDIYLKNIDDVNVLAKCNDAKEAETALAEFQIDVMFIDIQMPGKNGLEFAKGLEKPPLIVFTTAYPNYALEGFELEALDYLLKPISEDRFKKTMQRVREKLKIAAPNTGSESDEKDYFFVKADKKLIKAFYDDIVFIEGLKDYVIIWMENSRIITLQTMKSLDEKLQSRNFRRIHRSFIVNLKKIKSSGGNKIDVVAKGMNKQIPIGKLYRDEINKILSDDRI